MQASVMALRVLAWAVVCIFISRFSQDHHSKKWYTAPRFFYCTARRGAEEQTKTEEPTE